MFYYDKNVIQSFKVFRLQKKIRDNLVSCSLYKIYRQQWVPFLALVFVVTRVPSSTLPYLFPDLNPIPLFSIILHAPPSTSFTAFLAAILSFTLPNTGYTSLGSS